jgi:hypothetical protein
MIAQPELLRWLKTIPSTSAVAVDDGGLNLVEIDKNGKQTDAYWEVGGIPTDEDRAEDAAEAQQAEPAVSRKSNKKRA